MCPADRLTVLERDVSSSTLPPGLKAHAGDHMEEAQRTPAQNDLSTLQHDMREKRKYSILTIKSD